MRTLESALHRGGLGPVVNDEAGARAGPLVVVACSISGRIAKSCCPDDSKKLSE